jgi:phthalate 4,5-cis-dihydrodiol dehydrogenase
MASDGKFRVGIVGLGAGTMNMIPELAANPNVRITAAADPRKPARERFAKEFGGQVFDDAVGVCASPDVDIVYVMSPDELHAEHAVMAAQGGKQILADKPMGITLEECDQVIAATEKAGVRIIVGHSQSLDLPILKMAEIAASGQLGKPMMTHTMFYSDWIYRPRVREELMQERGGSIVRRQGPIQVDILRMTGGGLVRSVKAMTRVADPDRPIDGAYTAMLEFEDGHVGVMTYNGYGYFDSSVLTYGYTLQGFPYEPGLHPSSHRRIKELGGIEAEEEFKEATRYGGRLNRSAEQKVSPDRRHAFFGFTLVSCERGDIRQTPTGLALYTADGEQPVELPAGPGYNHRYGAVEVGEMCAAMREDRPVRVHDGRWGKATLEVVLGILESARTRKEVQMHHQVAYKGVGVS